MVAVVPRLLAMLELAARQQTVELVAQQQTQVATPLLGVVVLLQNETVEAVVIHTQLVTRLMEVVAWGVGVQVILLIGGAEALQMVMPLVAVLAEAPQEALQVAVLARIITILLEVS